MSILVYRIRSSFLVIHLFVLNLNPEDTRRTTTPDIVERGTRERTLHSALSESP